jgi:hypothetical protein
MQIGSVPFVTPSDIRDYSSSASSDNAELKSQNSTLSALNEPSGTEASGRQSEQKPEQQAESPSEFVDQSNSNLKSERELAEFTEQELQQIKELEARDREVRVHEQAHQSVGGQYTGAASYTYQRGPDGVNYAIGGEVSINAGPVQGDPKATIEKADVVRRAALAPAEPSVQDRLVAAEASRMKLEAQAELAAIEAEERQEELNEDNDDEGSSEAAASSENNTNQTESSVSPNDTSSESSADTESEDENVSAEFIDASLSPDDLANLLASEVARRNAMAVFENINQEPPKINLDELV